MSPKDALRAFKIISKYWKGKIGFHSHNNKGFALINSLELINKNINYCDCTMMGMGRGAGNVSTESLLFELNSLGLKETNFKILQTSLDDFEKLKKSMIGDLILFTILLLIKTYTPLMSKRC